LRPDFLGWVGLNIGNHGEWVRVNPNIGIHCVPVEKLWRDLVGDKSRPYKRGEFATVSVPLGMLCPDNIDAVEFTIRGPLEGEARRLAMLIGEYGVPWMVENASYEALVPLLEAQFSHLPNYPERLAGAYYYAGNYEKARAFAHDVSAEFLRRNDDVLINEFQRFAVPFLELLTAGSG